MPLDEIPLANVEAQIDASLNAVLGNHGLSHDMAALQLIQDEVNAIDIPQPYASGSTRVTVNDLTSVQAVVTKHSRLTSRVQHLINLKLQSQLAAALAAAPHGASVAGTSAAGTSAGGTAHPRTFTPDEDRLISVLKGMRIAPPQMFEGQACGIDPTAWTAEFPTYFAMMARFGGNNYQIPLDFKIEFLRTRLGESGKKWFDTSVARPEFVAAQASWDAFINFFIQEMSLVDQRSIDRVTAESLRFTTAQELYRSLITLQRKVGTDPSSQNSLPDGVLARMYYAKLPKAMQEQASKKEAERKEALSDMNYTLTMGEILASATLVEKSDARFRNAAHAHQGALAPRLNALSQDDDVNIPQSAPPMDNHEAFMALMSRLDHQQHTLNTLQQQSLQTGQQTFNHQMPSMPLLSPSASMVQTGSTHSALPQLHAMTPPQSQPHLSPEQLYSLYGDNFETCMPIEEATADDEPMDQTDVTLYALAQRNHRIAQKKSMQTSYPGGAGYSSSMPPRLQARIRCHNCGEFGHMMRQCQKPARYKRTPFRTMRRRPIHMGQGARAPFRPRATRNFRASPQTGQLQSAIADSDVLNHQIDDDEFIWSVDADIHEPYVYA